LIILLSDSDQGGVTIQQQQGVHDTSFSLPISYSSHYKIIASDAGWYNSTGASTTSLSVATVFNASEIGYGVNWIAVGV
jgi:hypothetical protein